MKMSANKPSRKTSASNLKRESTKNSLFNSTKAKKQIEELTNENTEVKVQLESIKEENIKLKEKLNTVIKKVIDSCTEEEKEDYGIAENANILDVNVDDVIEMISKLVTKKLNINKNTIEARIEDLETRLTEQSMQMANMVKTRFILENGLAGIALCPSVETVREKVEELQFAIEEPYPMVTIETDPPPVCTDHTSDHQAELVATLEKTSLLPPDRKLPGDTHIRFLHKELKCFILNELSLEKASRQDWRTLAIRLGVPSERVTEWEHSKYECPMKQVFSFWGRSNAATIRMLHRHLVSPQIRALLLAKRISDFYDVD